MKKTRSNIGLKRVNGEYGDVDSMISRSEMGEQYIMSLKSVMGEQRVKEQAATWA